MVARGAAAGKKAEAEPRSARRVSTVLYIVIWTEYTQVLPSERSKIVFGPEGTVLNK